MASIFLEKISLNYPIYGTNSRSLKHSLVNVTTGGKLQQNDKTVTVAALTDISFSLKKGDRLGLIGHNGAGKSTLLRLLAGVYEPTVGKIKVEGSIGSLLDISMGMDPEASGYENIKIRGMILGLSKQQINSMIPDIEAFTEMGDFLAMPVKTYSSGMALRLAFAMSTTIAPNILLMDEVIGAGDANFMERAQKRLEDFVHQSDILVCATHSNDAIRRMCNKVLWLEHGKIRGFGDTEMILPDYEHQH